MDDSLFSPLLFGLTLVVFATAFVSDLKTQRIPNWLSLSALGAGLLLHTTHSGWSGFGTALLGAMAGLVLIPCYLKRFVAAGDVKLMVGLGALMGPVPTLWVIALGVALGAVICPLLAVGKVGWHGLWATAKRYGQCLRLGTYLPPQQGEAASTHVPYAPALAAGWALTLFIQLPGM